MRWMTPTEYARLMGVDDYVLIGVTPGQALFGFGDAVAAPVVEWIGREYLMPMVRHLPVHVEHLGGDFPCRMSQNPRYGSRHGSSSRPVLTASRRRWRFAKRDAVCTTPESGRNGVIPPGRSPSTRGRRVDVVGHRRAAHAVSRHLTDCGARRNTRRDVGVRRTCDLAAWQFDLTCSPRRAVLDPTNIPHIDRIDSRFKAILNEKIPPVTSRLTRMPPSLFRRSLIDPADREERSHPDIRIARRAETISRLADVALSEAMCRADSTSSG